VLISGPISTLSRLAPWAWLFLVGAVVPYLGWAQSGTLVRGLTVVLTPPATASEGVGLAGRASFDGVTPA